MILGTRSTSALRIALCVMALGVARQAAAETIMVEWDPATEPVGYKVHVGVQPGTYTQHYDVGSATLFSFTNAAAGQRYCFSVSAYLLSSQLEGPLSSEVCGYSNQPPTLANPGARNSTVGVAITQLQLVGSDPDSQPLTYSATGLPPGLSVHPSAGYISGTGTAAGTYSVTARASDGVLTASQTFTWTMTAPAGDTTRPTISITSPTSNSTLSTPSSAITLGGTAADNVGVVQVKWPGGSVFLAAGATTWSTSAIPLVSGSNVITVTAVDAAGNEGTDSITVTYSAPAPTDTTPPTVSIVTPTTGTTFLSTSATLNLTGSASDTVGVKQVSWTNDRGGSGNASNTTSWAIGSIALQTGTNIINVIAIDAAGNAGSDTLTVTYSAPTSSGTGVTLTAARSGSRSVSLTWSGASWSRVSIYRNGVVIKETRNNGSSNDNPKSGGVFEYKVCAANSTTLCSNTASVSF